MKELNKRQLRRILRQCKEATKPEAGGPYRTECGHDQRSLLEDLLKTGEVAVRAGPFGRTPQHRYQYRPVAASVRPSE